MAIFNKLGKFFINDITGFNGADVIEERLPVHPEWFWVARQGQPRSININQLRKFARSPWIQMVLNTIKKEVTTIPWDVIEDDSESGVLHEKEIIEFKDFLENINQEREDISDLGSQAVTDIGEIDAQVWVNVFTRDSYVVEDVPILDHTGRETGSTESRIVLKPFGNRKLAQVRPADGSTFLKQIDIHRRLMAYYQYSFKNPRTNPIRFEPDEVIYSLLNQKSYSIYGYSQVQAVQQILELLIQSTRWNKDFYVKNAIPDGIVSLPGADGKALQKFERMWNTKAKGKRHKLLFQNSDAKFQMFAPNNRDMEWLNGQKWYHQLIFGIFGVSPVEAGFHENVSKGNTDGQERITVKNAIKPFLNIIENNVNKRILIEFFQNEKPGIKFKYFPKDHQQEKIEHEQSMNELDKGALTINEFRKEKGRKPIPGGDVANIQTNNQPGNPDDPNDPNDPKKDDPIKEDPKKDKYFSKSFSKYMKNKED